MFLQALGTLVLVVVILASASLGYSAAMFGTSAVHQILAAVYFLIFTVAFSTLTVVAEMRLRGRGAGPYAKAIRPTA